MTSTTLANVVFQVSDHVAPHAKARQIIAIIPKRIPKGAESCSSSLCEVVGPERKLTSGNSARVSRIPVNRWPLDSKMRIAIDPKTRP